MTFQVSTTWLAQRDLDEIASHTLEQWGRRQMVRYMAELEARTDTLADSPLTKGRQVEGTDLRRLNHHNHYFIFFRVVGERVEIIRVLHQRRDWHGIMSGS